MFLQKFYQQHNSKSVVVFTIIIIYHYTYWDGGSHRFSCFEYFWEG